MLTKNKIKNIVEAILTLRDSATDEQALTATALYPEWQPEKDYVTGARIVFNNTLYKVLQNHTSQAEWLPNSAASLYAIVLTSDTGKALPWVQPESTNPYMTGDKVTHNGSNWVCTIDNNTWEPGVYGWEAEA